VTSGGRTHALASYGGSGGTRSFFPQNAACDGMFFTTGPASEPQTGQRAVRLREVDDGLSKTLLLGERSHDDANYASFVQAGWKDGLADWGWWAPTGGRKAIGHVSLSTFAPLNFRMPVDYAHRSQAQPPAANAAAFQHYNELRLSAYGSSHQGGANFALADGAVDFFVDSIDPAVFAALATRAGHDRGPLME
jgi:prepilin-type processing-associated H-X9-DG protein